MLILFNKYINTIIYIFIYTLLLHGLAVALHASGVIPDGWWCIPDGWWCIPDGWWCIPGGWWCLPGGWWCILASSAAYCSRAPRQGHAPTTQCGGGLA